MVHVVLMMDVAASDLFSISTSVEMSCGKQRLDAAIKHILLFAAESELNSCHVVDKGWSSGSSFSDSSASVLLLCCW